MSAQQSLKSFQAFTVEMFHESQHEAKPGDVVGVNLRGQPTAPFYAYPDGALLSTHSLAEKRTAPHGHTAHTAHTAHRCGDHARRRVRGVACGADGDGVGRTGGGSWRLRRQGARS